MSPSVFADRHLDRRLVVPAAALLLAATLASPAAAATKTYRAETTDPTGDAPAPGRDITNVKVRYKTNGSILFVITLAGPVDAANADAGVGVSLGSTCNKLLLTGAGQFSAPDPLPFFKVISNKKLGKARKGHGEITANVFTMKAKHSSFAGFKPGCFAVALLDPATPKGQVAVPFDQTGEIKFK